MASPPELKKDRAFGGGGKPHVERGERASRGNDELHRSISKVGLAGQRRGTRANETNATALEKERATAKSNARRAGMAGKARASEMA